MTLLLLSLAPVFILLAYVYFRDKYEKEPLGLLLKGFIAGVIILFPVAFLEQKLMTLFPELSGLGKAAYEGFIVAGTSEEFFKFAVLYLIFWRNRNFNEKFDGIVYAVSVSLGFAAIENVFYVFEGSYSVGFLRAVTAVPAHTLFGIMMGYFLGLAKFIPERKEEFLWKAVMIPILFHGSYDFFVLSGHPLLVLLFIPLLIVMWRIGLRRMKQHVDASVFRNQPPPPPGPYPHDPTPPQI
jgi:RsiW-degrading membrane proteinase PrsW (M82 family)